MSRVFEIPLNTGLDEGGDRAMLETGKLRLLQNARIARDNRIECRPQYVAQGITVWGGANLLAQDLATYEDRLLAFGCSSGTGTYSKDVYTYINQAQGVWKNLFDSNAVNYPVFPFVQDVEILWTAPAGPQMSGSDIAYTSTGYLCAIQTNPVTAISNVYVLRGALALPVQTLSLTASVSARVVACGNTFVLLSRTSAGSITARTFATGVDNAWSSPTTLVVTEATGTFTWDACALSGGTDFLICYPRPATVNMRVQRYSAALALQATNTVAVTPGNMCVIGDTSNGVMFCHVTATGNCSLYTMNPSTLVTTSGPTNVLGPGTGQQTNVGTPALWFSRTTRCSIQCQCPNGIGPDSQYAVVDIAGHAGVTADTFNNVRISSKIFTQQQDATNFLGSGLGAMVVGGNTAGTDQVYATHIQAVNLGFICSGRWNYGVADLLIDSIGTNSHGRSSVATDGAGTFWACCGTLDEGLIGTTAGGTLQVVRFRSGVTSRRQAVEAQGALYIAGGFTGYFDGSTLVESGFLDTPIIKSNVQSATGSLTLLAAYQYIACYEWFDSKGRLHRSTPSTPFAVTMTGANNANAVTVSTARSYRRVDINGNGSAVKTVLYRNTPGDSVFYRVAEGSATTTTTDYANDIAITDTRSDTGAQTRPVLYIYSQKPTANVGPIPCRFIAMGRDRLIYGGLPDPYLVAFSQLVFPAEPIEGASPNSFAYVARLPEPVTAVSAPGDSYIAFTEQGIYEIPGAGPQRNGTGEFFTPRTLFSDGGCIDWRSVCETAKGTFFQLASDKLYLLTPQGELQWVGKPIQDTLTTYPVIRAAALCTATQRVTFAVVDSDTAPTVGGLLTYDIQKDAWSFDDVGIVQAVVEYNSLLAYLHNDGSVYLEQATVGSGGGTMPTMSIRTGSLRLFSGMGYGDIMKIGLLGTYLGDCTVQGFISYDDGKTWTDMGTESVTAANLFNPVSGAAMSAGDPVSVIFTPNKRTVDRFALRFDIVGGTNSGGMRAHMVSLEVESQDFTTRQPARNQR